MIRRYVAEFVGTAMIVFVPVAYASGGGQDLAAAAWASGLVVLAMIATLGAICGAHFNPAVTIAFTLVRRFPARYCATYLAAQMLGGVAGAGLAFAIFQRAAGAHIPAETAVAWSAVAGEAAITFILMATIMATATDRRVPAALPPIAIGLAVVVGVLAMGNWTGGSMNPARSFGPALFNLDAWRFLWIYAVGPILGAISAAFIYEWLRLSPESAQGAPSDLS